MIRTNLTRFILIKFNNLRKFPLIKVNRHLKTVSKKETKKAHTRPHSTRFHFPFKFGYEALH